MRFEKFKEMDVVKLAAYMNACGACPSTSDHDGNYFPCIRDDEDNLDCETCWLMELKGEQRGETYDEFAKANWRI